MAVEAGTCTACYSLYDLQEARNKLDAAVRRRQGAAQKEATAPAEPPAVQPEEV
jgi:hypothetical protein